jgi:hypothetical protein
MFSVLALGGYALYCWWHLRAYVGTGHYWTNQWFYKSHACLIVLIIINLFIPRCVVRAKNDSRTIQAANGKVEYRRRY